MNGRLAWRRVGLLACLVGLAPAGASAQLRLAPYVSGLSQPVGMVQDPTDATVQYVLEKGGDANPGTGRIRVIKDGVLRAQPFLELQVQTTSECGMLGLAFPADYATSRRFYVYHCLYQGNGDTQISRFLRSTADPYLADPNSRFDLELEPGQRYLSQPYENHKGGKMVFGTDGYLYVGVGDGGSGGDPGNRAQNPNELFGKILRLDVNVDLSDSKGYRIPPDNPFLDGNPIAARGEIWDLGVRNPRGFSFDDASRGGTGALVIADVGQGQWEEVDYEPAAVHGGRNYGWPIREGANDYDTSRPRAFNPLIEPIYNYSHSFGQSITGGYVYRGSALGADYVGRYFLADYVSKKIVSLGLSIGSNGEATVTNTIDHTAQLKATTFGNVTSIDVDASGELYFVMFDGTIRKLVFDQAADTDGDGLPDVWETQFGLNPGLATGNDGANGDPDGDGRTNLQEYQAGTHPNNVAALDRYFAEGASSTFFGMQIALANPGSTIARVNVRFLRADGATFSKALTIDPMTRATVSPADVPGVAQATFSTVIETDQPIVAERTMFWPTDVRYGSHTETAVTAPAPKWYLAEGATLGQFDLYYLIENPNPTPTTIEVTYLRLAPATPIVKQYTVGANSRLTIDVQGEGPELFDAEMSAVIRSVDDTTGIIVERAMYLNGGNQLWRAGHDAAGVTAPSQHWFFAEGATGTFFDMYLLLANPGETDANVTLRFLRPNNLPPIDVTRTVAAHSRWTENVEGVDPALAAETMSTVVESDVPIVAERAMYWPGLAQGGWYEGADSPGVTGTGTAWAVADGEVGGAYATQTYVLIANTSPFPGRARITLLPEGTDPAIAPSEIDLPADGRLTLSFENVIASGKRFSVLVESIPAAGGTADIVVERATYSNDSTGLMWSAGGSAVATKIR